MNLNFDQRFLNRVIIVLVAGMIIAGVLIGLKVFGFLGSDTISPVPVTGDDGYSDGEDGPVDSRSLENTLSDPGYEGTTTDEDGEDRKILKAVWTYNNESFEYSQTVSNDTYYSFRPVALPAANGTTGDLRLLPYMVTTGDEGLVQGVASYILSQSAIMGWGDYDTIGNLVAFLHQYGGTDTFLNLPPAGSYKFPFQTMYDGTGSRDDVTILGAAILEAMGYPVGILDFPRQYDRGYFIYEYEGVAVRCDGSVQGRKYSVEHTIYLGEVTCWPGTGRYLLSNGSATAPSEGILRGNASIRYSDNQTRSAGVAEWDVRSGTMLYKDDISLRADRVVDRVLLENASWIGNDYFCYIDTTNPDTLPGTIPGELAKIEPRIHPFSTGTGEGIRIYRDDRIDATLMPSLRRPSPLNITGTAGSPVFEGSLTDELRIPGPSRDIDDVKAGNEQREGGYWEDVWYDRSSWYYDQLWYIDVVNYSVIESPYLYTRQDEMYIAPASAWRIRYSAIPLNPPDEDLPGLSTFSDMRFAVYKIDNAANTASLFDTFSYGYAAGQEDIKYRTYFETGTFYIAVFVRNCKADVSIQMHGKNPV